MTAHTEQNPFVAPRAAVDDVASGVDSEFKLNLFSAEGRIGRIRYLGYSLGLSYLILFIAGVLAAVTSPVLLMVAYVPVLYINVMLAIKRSHDFNTTGWLSILMPVPIINFLFVLVPGTNGPNRFGNKTAPNGRAGVFVILALLGVALIGIVAAIAIPAYSDYQKRVQAAQSSRTTPPSIQPPSATPR